VIDLDTLRRTANTKGINNIGYAEKDYFQEIIMLGISREAPELVFKGGTALYKIHGLDRFSEDLDFCGELGEPQARRISTYLRDFGYETEIVIKKAKTGVLLTFVTQGFLYQGTNESRARVQVDVNEAGVELDPEWPQFFSLYPDIPSFRLKVMALEEIAAEKVRALLVRKKARDAYDIWFLLNMGVKIKPSLVGKKLELYNMKLDKRSLKAALKETREIWKKELKPLMREVPDFVGTKHRIEEAIFKSS
jgi:predicted nucleotidyltransferase component of viral defense system